MRDANLPPDCEAIVDGVLAGIAVTELVHEQALARSIKAMRRGGSCGTRQSSSNGSEKSSN